MSALLGRLLAPALGVLLAMSLFFGVTQWSAARKFQDQFTQSRDDFAQYRATTERQARMALELQAKKDAITNRLRQEAQDAELLARKAADADRDALRDSRDRLQRYSTDLATSLDRAGRQDSSAASSSPATGGTGRVLAEMLSRIDDAAAEVAAYADASRRAGQLCERTYDALTVEPEP